MINLKKSVMYTIIVVILLITGIVVSNNIPSMTDELKTAPYVSITDFGSQEKSKLIAPDFTLWTLDGSEFHLSDLKGHVLLINFWATWCAPCRVEIPDLVKLSTEHRDEGFEVVAITLSSGSPEDIALFADKFNMSYYVLTSTDESITAQVVKDYGDVIGQAITGIPTTFLIDREGIIREVYVGPRSKSVFWEDIKKYL